MPIANILLKVSKMRGMGLNGFIFRKINENENIKERKKSW